MDVDQLGHRENRHEQATVSSETDTSWRFNVPDARQEMTRALLDLLMPANSIGECTRHIATYDQKGAGTVSAYAMKPSTVSSFLCNRTDSFVYYQLVIYRSKHGC